MSSRIPCDGHTAPQDQVFAKATFSEGATQRTFTLSEYQKGGCKVDLKIHCVDKVPTGWRQDWSVSSADEPHPSQLSIDACYEWGSPEPAQYVVSAWYKPAGATKKTPWVQAALKKVSSSPEIYEFSDEAGGTGRLELDRR